MSLSPSTASESHLDYYTNGACHHLAIALNRKLGWFIDVRTDASEPYWQDEADADNFLPAVLHVYAIDPQGRAWDVRGCRPGADVAAEIEEHYAPGEPDSEEFAREAYMRHLVGCWAEPDEEEGEAEPIDRPLEDYTDQDIEEAWQVVVEIFGGMDGFNPQQAPAPSRTRPAR